MHMHMRMYIIMDIMAMNCFFITVLSPFSLLLGIMISAGFHIVNSFDCIYIVFTDGSKIAVINKFLHFSARAVIMVSCMKKEADPDVHIQKSNP